MAENMMFGVAVIAERKFFVGGDNGECGVNIFLVFFGFFGVATGTIDIQEAFSEMKKRVGVGVAIHTGHIAFPVDVLGPFLRIHENRPDRSCGGNLCQVGFSVTE